jgi:hypothetical protein
MKIQSKIWLLLIVGLALCQVEQANIIEDVFQSQINELREKIREHSKSFTFGGRKSKEFKKLINDQKFFCSGGQDPAKLTKKEYLEAFAKSSCAPTLLIPGASMSKLII